VKAEGNQSNAKTARRTTGGRGGQEQHALRRVGSRGKQEKADDQELDENRRKSEEKGAGTTIVRVDNFSCRRAG